MRSVAVMVKLALATKSPFKYNGHNNIECTLENAQGNSIAVMVKLALATKSPFKYNGHEDFDFLSAMFSDNYLTVMPGETSRVKISLDSIELMEQKGLWKCSPNGLMNFFGSFESELMVSIDGWNIKRKDVQITCTLSSLVA